MSSSRPDLPPLFRQLRREQMHENNLTTFVPAPSPGALMTIPYPVDNNGHKIGPNYIFCYLKTYEFEIRCFHDVKVRTWPVKSGPLAGKFYAGCGKKKSENCSFKICLSDVHALPPNELWTRNYPPRQALHPDPLNDMMGTVIDELPHALSPLADVTCASTSASVSRRDFKPLQVITKQDMVPFFRLDGSVNDTVAARGDGSRSHDFELPADDDTSSMLAAALNYSYSLPVDMATTPSSCRGLSLSTSDESDHAAHAIAHGDLARTLDDPAGMPAHVFWRLYGFCGGCNSIVDIRFYESRDHICDLTDL